MNYHEHLTVFGHAQPPQKVTAMSACARHGEGSDKKPGLQKKRETRTVKANELFVELQGGTISVPLQEAAIL
jgi:hypothetical protein